MAALTDGFHLFLDQFSSIVNFMMAICYREQGLDQLQLYEDEVSLDREKLENIFPCNAAISPLLAIIIDAYCIHRCKDVASIESSTECSTALPDALLITRSAEQFPTPMVSFRSTLLVSRLETLTAWTKTVRGCWSISLFFIGSEDRHKDKHQGFCSKELAPLQDWPGLLRIHQA